MMAYKPPLTIGFVIFYIPICILVLVCAFCDWWRDRHKCLDCNGTGYYSIAETRGPDVLFFLRLCKRCHGVGKIA